MQNCIARCQEKDAAACSFRGVLLFQGGALLGEFVRKFRREGYIDRLFSVWCFGRRLIDQSSHSSGFVATPTRTGHADCPEGNKSRHRIVLPPISMQEPLFRVKYFVAVHHGTLIPRRSAAASVTRDRIAELSTAEIGDHHAHTRYNGTQTRSAQQQSTTAMNSGEPESIPN